MSVQLLELKDLCKAFHGVSVLKGVSLQIRSGQTLGIVGENGAGKSTLMNILGGNLSADSGQILWQGQPFQPGSPRDAERQGIAFIHQELNLFPNLTVAENLFLSYLPRRWGWIDRTSMRERSRLLLEQVGLDLAPHLPIEKLSSGERQLVEIAKAINQQAKLIIFDEPTTSLTASEVQRLFELIASLKSRNVAIIYISHTLGDVLQLCDSIAVLRDGAVVASAPTAEFETKRLVKLMVGRELDQQYPPRSKHPLGQPVLTVRSVSQPGVVDDIDLTLHAGEILGISGLMGSGRTELLRILFGLDAILQGQILLDDQPIESLSTRQRISAGLALVTESRRDDGLCMPASIADNTSLVSAWRFAQSLTGILSKQGLGRAIAQTLDSVALPDSVDRNNPVGTLSGGNQQKVVLAKWLIHQPKVLMLDEPTRGVDVGAKFEIYLLVQRLAQSGTGVLVVSSEIEELIGICDRIMVMNRGELREQFLRDEFDRERILQASLQLTAVATGAT